jgi:hypothetical protein
MTDRTKYEKKIEEPAGKRDRPRELRQTPRSNGYWKNCFSLVLYRQRDAIERMFVPQKRHQIRRPRGYRGLLITNRRSQKTVARFPLPKHEFTPKRNCCDSFLGHACVGNFSNFVMIEAEQTRKLQQ